MNSILRRLISSFARSIALVVITSALLTVVMLHHAYAHSGDNEAFSDVESSEPGEVHVDAEGRKALGIKIATVEKTKLKASLKATGEVQAAETQAFDITPTVSGLVKQVLAKQGDTVRKGQTLAVVHSIEVASTLTQLLNERARINAEIAKTRTQLTGEITLQNNQVRITKLAADREEQLFREGINSQKSLLEAKNAYDSAKIKLTTLEQRLGQDILLLQKQLSVTVQTTKGELKIMGISAGAVDSALKTGIVTADLPIVTPVAGSVISRAITLGERVDTTKKIFSIVNLSPIWVMVDIYQEQIPLVQTGQSVVIQTPSKEEMIGKISSVGSVVDPTTKTLHVRIITDNQKGSLRPGMFVTAQIAVGAAVKEALAIPQSAIVYDKERPLVYKVHDDHFEPIFIKVGAHIGSLVEVISGLIEGDQIVVSGSSQLRSEGLLKPGVEEKHEGEKHQDHDSHEHEATASTSDSAHHMILFASGIAAAFAFLLIWIVIAKMLKKKGAS